MRVGRSPIDETAIRLLEQHNPDVQFDWTRILKAPPAAEGQGRRDTRDARDRDQRGRREARSSQRSRSGGAPPPPGPPPRHTGAGATRVAPGGEAVPEPPAVVDETASMEMADVPQPAGVARAAAQYVDPAFAEFAEYLDRADQEAAERAASGDAEPAGAAEPLGTVADVDAVEPVEAAEAVEPVDAIERHGTVEPADVAEAFAARPEDEGSASYQRLGAEGLVRLRARYAEVMARIAERPLEEEAREELKQRAERLNPDAWVTADEVTAALEQYETVFEGLRGIVGRHPRQRRRRR